MAAFVGFDPLKSHRPQILRLAASLSILLVVSLVVFGRYGA